jgi:hypothetical protein
MKNPRTQNEIRNDPRVEDLSFDGEVWDVFLRAGFAFDGERRISVGTIGSIGSDMRTIVAVPVVNGQNAY